MKGILKNGMLTQFLKNEMPTLVGVLILRYPNNIGGTKYNK
jgi:hypothetical protein